MADIFISYERSDRAVAGRIAAVLEKNGWSVWWDRNLFAGETFDRTIQQALDLARCVVVLWSRTSVVSAWVKDEASDGARRGILVPALIDDVDIPLGFRQIHAVRITGLETELSTEFDDILKSVRHLLQHPRQIAAPDNELFSETPPVGQRKRPGSESHGNNRNGWKVMKWVNVAPYRYMMATAGAIVLLALGVALRQFEFFSPSGTSNALDEDRTMASANEPLPAALPEITAAGQEESAETNPSTVVEAAGIVVSGTGQDLYYVYDSTGEKELAYAYTNREIELFPGTYSVTLHGVRQTATIDEKRRTVLQTGRMAVPGIGQDLYYVYDSTGEKELAYAYTNREIELFPGTYSVTLHGVRQTATIAAKRQTVLDAGRINVPGIGQDLYYVYASTGEKELAYAYTNREIELFPGTYSVTLHGVRQTATIAAKRQTVLDAGRINVPGTGKDLYYVYDSGGQKELAYAYTSREIELFPGTYVIGLNQMKRPIQIVAKRKTTIDR